MCLTPHELVSVFARHREHAMKAAIHPEYKEITVTCTCDRRGTSASGDRSKPGPCRDALRERLFLTAQPGTGLGRRGVASCVAHSSPPSVAPPRSPRAAAPPTRKAARTTSSSAP
ncbi:MAG: hypothetical protein E6K50_09690 [Gammaproteobacteria bacterium]|nr:MAG: hypothetical protein E6K50_09690 [Gammaproteobacteria bacterium]